jgi:hypothetical protein
MCSYFSINRRTRVCMWCDCVCLCLCEVCYVSRPTICPQTRSQNLWNGRPWPWPCWPLSPPNR